LNPLNLPAMVDEMKTGLTKQDNPPPQANTPSEEILDLRTKPHYLAAGAEPLSAGVRGHATLLPYRHHHTAHRLDVPVGQPSALMTQPALPHPPLQRGRSRALIDKQIADGFSTRKLKTLAPLEGAR
jgi:hypothetical protein